MDSFCTLARSTRENAVNWENRGEKDLLSLSVRHLEEFYSCPLTDLESQIQFDSRVGQSQKRPVSEEGERLKEPQAGLQIQNVPNWTTCGPCPYPNPYQNPSQRSRKHLGNPPTMQITLIVSPNKGNAKQ